MLHRRKLLTGLALSGLTLGAGLLEARRRRGRDKCGARCFSEDWLGLGYESFYRSLFAIGRSGQLISIAAGPEIRTEVRAAFGGDRLHAARPNSFDSSLSRREDGYVLYDIRFTLDCGLPIVGTMGIPHVAPKGLALLAHGVSTTPARCFNSVRPDYMRAIGSRLCAAGFAVWCPFMPQAGNEASLDDLAGMLTFQGISYHNACCSALHLGPWILQQLEQPELRPVRYGMSWGSVMSAHLEAATGEQIPTVLSGYLRDEKMVMESTWLEANAGSQFATYLHELTGAAHLFFPQIAHVLRPCRLYFEVGDRDGLSNNAFGRDKVFADIQAIYRETNSADSVALEVFKGEHEIAGARAIDWLTSSL
jgi:hypothetical protein